MSTCTLSVTVRQVVHAALTELHGRKHLFICGKTDVSGHELGRILVEPGWLHMRSLTL